MDSILAVKCWEMLDSRSIQDQAKIGRGQDKVDFRMTKTCKNCP